MACFFFFFGKSSYLDQDFIEQYYTIFCLVLLIGLLLPQILLVECWWKSADIICGSLFLLQTIAFVSCVRDFWPVLVLTPSSLRLHWASVSFILYVQYMPLILNIDHKLILI